MGVAVQLPTNCPRQLHDKIHALAPWHTLAIEFPLRSRPQKTPTDISVVPTAAGALVAVSVPLLQALSRSSGLPPPEFRTSEWPRSTCPEHRCCS
eukprot:scaffold23419_cov26-Tisochrysis_lutea.AAC.1